MPSGASNQLHSAPLERSAVPSWFFPRRPYSRLLASLGTALPRAHTNPPDPGVCVLSNCRTLTLSEVMTIEVAFHQSGYRTFKDLYLRYVTPHLRWAFPRLVSYTRFVELMQHALIPLCAYLQTRKGHSEGIAFIDSTLLAVCHPKRSAGHRVFAGLAGWGKNAFGWCYGFKLHLLINDMGEVLACYLTPANVDDRRPVPRLVGRLQGKVFGDRGYISQALFENLFAHGGQLITTLRKDMKNKLLPLMDKLLLRKRS
jgi:hypothetical protein